MKSTIHYLMLTIASCSLAVCATNSLAADVSDNAQTACMVAVNNNYGGNVKDLSIVRSEFSQANSEVIINADGERWRCLVSNDGQVQDLSVQESGGGAQNNFADLVGMRARDLDGEMADRGFITTGGYKTDTSAFTTWWNADSRQCLSVETSDGQVAAIESIVEGNCL